MPVTFSLAGLIVFFNIGFAGNFPGASREALSYNASSYYIENIFFFIFSKQSHSTGFLTSNEQ